MSCACIGGYFTSITPAVGEPSVCPRSSVQEPITVSAASPSERAWWVGRSKEQSAHSKSDKQRYTMGHLFALGMFSSREGLGFQSQALTSNEKGKLSVCSFTDTLIWHPLPPSRAVPVPSCLLLFLPLCFTAVAWSSLHGTQSWSKVTICSLPLYRLHSLLR